MSLAGEFKRRLRMLLHRGQFRRELDEEMRLHLELRHEQQIASGLTLKEAHWSAQRRFGNVNRIKERSHMEWGWSWLETFLQDAGYGLRSMLRTPAITVVALTSLALGIGANTAIFSFLDAIMLRSLPIREPQRLVKLGVEDPGGITDVFANTELYSYPFYRQFQRKNAVFSDTAAEYSMTNAVHGFIDNRQDSQLIQVKAVSGTYFQTLGVSAQVGRVLNGVDDSSKGDHPVVVISDAFWKGTFGADPSVLSHKLKLGNVVYDIVGVAPPEFFGTKVGEAPDAWAPLSMADVIPPGWGGYDKNFTEGLYILGRLKPGVTREQATANANVLFPQILRGFPDANLSQWNLVRAIASACVAQEHGQRHLRSARQLLETPDRAHGDRWTGAAYCVCEHRQSAAGAFHGTGARTGCAPGIGRTQVADHPPAFDREPAVGADGRSAGYCVCCGCRSSAAAHDFAGLRSRSAGCLAQSATACFYVCGHRLHGAAVWHIAGFTGYARATGGESQEWPWSIDCRGPVTDGKDPCCLAGGAFAGPDGGCVSFSAHARKPEPRRHRLQQGECTASRHRLGHYRV